MLRRLLFVAAVAFVATGAVPASVATAGGTKCVALVVDFTAFGGSVSSTCVRAASTDATGDDILRKYGHHHVTYRGDGLICAIDDKPAGGCHDIDATHYWVYYHRARGSSSWQYSQVGASSDVPPNASTEGWVFDNGQSAAPKPSNVPYSRICPAAAPTPTPKPTTTRTTSHPAATTAAATPQRTPTSLSSRHASPVPTRSEVTRPSATLSAGSAVPSSSPTTSATSAASPTPAHRSRFPVLPVSGGVAAAALGAAAALRFRRARG